VKVTRIDDAQPYQAPGHYDMRSLRLHGWDISDSKNFWVGLSHFLPGGGAEKDASPLEKVYVVLSGEITIVQQDGETVLSAMDSCFIGPHEEREIINRSNQPATMLVIMPYPENAK